VDVNYSGSSGYGRDYIERLNPNWGCLDPDDCISTAEAISNWQDDPVDPKRIVIRGGSSGGFTVLCALSHSRNLTAFGAGTSLYGISNLENLVKYTHKFESSYMDKLLGGTIKQIPEVYKDRSPLTHANDIKSPLLVRCLLAVYPSCC
jgi:dipeptidyl aminopeptidase/acylaminoacyl peptidase